MVPQQSFSAFRMLDTTLSRRDMVRIVAGGTALGLSGLLIGHRQFAMAQSTPMAADLSAYPDVTITAEGDMSAGYSFGVPDSLPTGYVKVTLQNKSDADHHAMFLRPNKDVTADQLVEKIKAAKNPGEYAQMASSVGGPGSISVGQSSTVIMNLEEGSYVLICEIPGPDGTPHYLMGMVSQVEAKASGMPVTTAPTAETTVDLVDFSFKNLPATVTTGQHVWEVHNSGTEQHELAIFQLAPGVTGKMMYGMLAGSEAPAGSPAATAAVPSPVAAQAGPPFTDVAGAAPMDPDNTVWPVIDLQPGDYTAVCFIPDPKTGKPHFMLGMFMEFSVK